MNARLQGSEVMHPMQSYEPSVRHYHPRSRFAETIVAWHEKRQATREIHKLSTREIHKLYREMRQEHPEEIALTVSEEFSIILRDWWALVPHLRH